MLNKTNCNYKFLVVGIDNEGISVINSLIDFNCPGLDYLAISNNIEVLNKAECDNKVKYNDDFSSIIKNRNVVFYVGSINSLETYNAFIKCICYNNSKIYNYAFINGSLCDDEFYNCLLNNRVLAFECNVDEMVLNISNISGLEANPGVIGTDMYDFSYYLKNHKKGYSYIINSNDLDQCAKYAYDFVLKHIDNIEGFYLIIECEYNDNIMPLIGDFCKSIKGLINNKVDLAYGNQSIKNSDYKYRISTFLAK